MELAEMKPESVPEEAETRTSRFSFNEPFMSNLTVLACAFNSEIFKPS
ncbi:MAG: hypothetical protein LM632_01090 [Armatimonadetes bacterium]|nr:hypothetical protein [Armatimonadota bacterium]